MDEAIRYPSLSVSEIYDNLSILIKNLQVQQVILKVRGILLEVRRVTCSGALFTSYMAELSYSLSNTALCDSNVFDTS